MKICYIGWADYPHVQAFASWFTKRGHVVHIVSNHPIKGLSDVTVHAIPTCLSRNTLGSPLTILQTIWRTRKLVHRIQPDILHSHALYYPGVLGGFCGWKPFVVTAWSIDDVFPTLNPRLRPAWVEQWLTHFALSKAQLVTGISNDLVTWIRKAGVDPSRSLTFHWGVDLERFCLPRDRETVRERLELPTEVPVILSVRNVGYPCNIESVIDAVPIVVDSVPDALFLFLWNFARAPLLERLKLRVRSLGLQNNVRWVGHVIYDKIHLYFQAADVFVSVPFWDSGPVSMIEAMACGAIPVMSDLPSVREWVEPAANGFLLSPKDTKALGGTIANTLRNPKVRKEIASRNRQMVVSRGDRNENFLRMEQVYEELSGQIPRRELLA